MSATLAPPASATPARPQAPPLARVLWLRASYLSIAACGLAFAGLRWQLHLDYGALLILIALGAAGLALGAWRLRCAEAHGTMELSGQLAFDLALLTGMFALSGGGANPLISLYLVVLAAAATALPLSAMAALAVLAVGAYSLLIATSTPTHPHAAGFYQHLQGMWLTFVLSALLLVTVVARLAQGIRDRDRRLAELREARLRDEQLVALGGLAANTAHALGTPLTTLALTLEELGDTQSVERNWTEALPLLQAQVHRCREELARLRPLAEPAENPLPLDEWLQEMVTTIRLLHPEKQVEVSGLSQGTATLALTSDPALRHALLNVLDNGARAADKRIWVHVTSEQQALTLTVRDDGHGICPKVMDHLDAPAVDPDGLGLGLFLANAAIERVGGSLAAIAADNGGTEVRIRLPQSP